MYYLLQLGNIFYIINLKYKSYKSLYKMVHVINSLYYIWWIRTKLRKLQFIKKYLENEIISKSVPAQINCKKETATSCQLILAGTLICRNSYSKHLCIYFFAEMIKNWSPHHLFHQPYPWPLRSSRRTAPAGPCSCGTLSSSSRIRSGRSCHPLHTQSRKSVRSR